MPVPHHHCPPSRERVSVCAATLEERVLFLLTEGEEGP